MTVHKTDSHNKRGHRRVKPPNEEATFDTELQRYVMPSERRATMLKQGER